MAARRIVLLCLLAMIWSHTSRAAQPLDVSLIQLIATPERFDGKAIRVIGFLKIEFEGNALYLHREDYEHANSRNAIWVDIYTRVNGKLDLASGFSKTKQEDLSEQYVLLEGDFDAKAKGHMGMFGGSIINIVRAETWPSRAEFEKMRENGKSK